MPDARRKKRDPALVRALDAAAERLGERIRTLRQERGLTLEGLAEASGALNPVHIWKIEHGQLNVELVTLVALARGLDLKVEDLFVRPKSAKRPRNPATPSAPGRSPAASPGSPASATRARARGGPRR